MDAVKDLVVVLEDEVRVGEDLLHNLFAQRNAIPVSYTHLTLPTNREV